MAVAANCIDIEEDFINPAVGKYAQNLQNMLLQSRLCTWFLCFNLLVRVCLVKISCFHITVSEFFYVTVKSNS